MTFLLAASTIDREIKIEKGTWKMDNRFLKQAMILCLSAALTVSSSFPALAAINNTHNNPDVYVSGTLINGVNTAGQTDRKSVV